MFRSTVWITFVVCSWTSHGVALPAAGAACRGRDAGAAREEAEAALVSCQQTIQVQAQTIQGLIQSALLSTARSLPSPPSPQAATLCTPDEQAARAITAAVDAAVARLEQRLQQQTLIIQGLIESLQNATVPNPGSAAAATASCASVEAVARAVTATINATVERSVQELKRSTPNCGTDSGYHYYPKSGKCFKLREQKSNWPQARSACAAEGARLAVIASRDDARQLGEVMAALTVDEAFIGVYQDDNRVWKTLTGESPTAAAGYDPWLSGEPPGDAFNKYAYVKQNGAINDGYLDRYSICEKVPH